MKKTFFTLFACVLACSAGATHFPPLTPGAVKRLAHDENHLYILHFNGLEVRDKATGETVCFTHDTGHFPESDSPKLDALAIHGDTVWVGGHGFLTAFVGTEATSWKFKWHSSVSMPDYYDRDITLPFDFNGIAYNSKGCMYVGGLDQVGYMKKLGKAAFVALPDNLRNGAEVWQMLADKDDAVWVSYTSDSGDNSLVKYSAGDEAVEAVSSKLGFGKGIKALALDKDNNLWFGSNHTRQLFRYDGNTLEEYEIGGDTGGWMYRGISCMSFDDKGRLWLLHSNAQILGYDHYSTGPLYCFSDGELTEYPFPADMGLAYCIDVDGEDVYVGTDNGVLMLVDGRLAPLDTPWYSGIQMETALVGLKQQQELPQSIYDLQGRRIVNGKSRNSEYLKVLKGVYISGGKKYVR